MRSKSTTPALLAAPGRAGLTERPIAPLHGPVLLATSGDAPSAAAARVARRIAERLGERLEVLAVLEPLPIDAMPYDLPVFPPSFDAQRRRRLEDDVIARMEPVLGSRANWHLDVRWGPIGAVIPDVARERGASITIVGSGQHGVVHRLLGDEIAIQVARRSTGPVLAVAPDATIPLHRAVVGIDFSSASLHAALVALALLENEPSCPALLSLVHVRSPFEHDYPILGSWASEYDAGISARLSRLREFLRPYVPNGVTIESRCRIGSTVAYLGETAEAIDADLIAVGTHGAGWIERLLLGSVATGVLRQTGRTVLITPTPPAPTRIVLDLGVVGQAIFSQADDWTGALDAFTRRNLGRPVRLEIADETPGATGTVTHAMPFRGATYDALGDVCEIMLGDEARDGRHLTHRVHDVRLVELVAHPTRGEDFLLYVEDTRGHSVLTFTDVAQTASANA